MSHIFTLEDLARCKVCLEFANHKEPPSIHWRSLSQPLSVTPSARSLSVRVNESFVNGRPSLTLFLVQDPDWADQQVIPDISSQPQQSHGVPPPQLKRGEQASPSVLTSSPSDMAVNCNTYGAHPIAGGSLISSSDDLIASAANLAIYSSSREQSLSPHFDFSSQSTVGPTETTSGFWPTLPSNFRGDTWQPDSGIGQDSGHLYVDSHSRNSPAIAQTLTLDNEDSSNSSSLSSLMAFDMFLGAATATQGSDQDWRESSCHSVTTSSLSTQSSNDPSSDSGWSDDHSFADANVPVPSPADSPPSESEQGVKRTRGNRRVRCSHSGCNRTFWNSATCSVHGRGLGTNKKKRVPCSICSETFSRRHDMMRHEASQHGKVQQWTCHVCRRFFSSETMLNDHKCPR